MEKEKREQERINNALNSLEDNEKYLDFPHLDTLATFKEAKCDICGNTHFAINIEAKENWHNDIYGGTVCINCINEQYNKFKDSQK